MQDQAFSWRDGAYRATPLCAPPSELPAGSALVRPRELGICASDLLHIAEQPAAGAVFGHEWQGVIERVAADVESRCAGEAVTSSAFLGCGNCQACLRGCTNHCRKASVLGAGSLGAARSWLVLPAAQLQPIPRVAAAGAVLLEPASVAVEAGGVVQRLAGDGPVAVVGGGPIGLLTACWLHERGRLLTVFEPQPFRRGLAERLGLEARDSVAVEGHPGDFAAVVDCSSAYAGGPGGWQLCLRLVRRGGSLVAVAKYPKGRTVARTELARAGVCVAWLRGAGLAALRGAADWGAQLAAYRPVLADPALPLADLDEALRRARLPARHGKQVLLVPQADTSLGSTGQAG